MFSSHPSRPLVAVATLVLLAGCGGPDDSSPHTSEVVCATHWEGEIPVASVLSIRACLTASDCSAVLTAEHYSWTPNCNGNPCGGGVADVISVPEPSGAATVEARWWDVQMPPVTVTSLGLQVDIVYTTRASDLLSDADRSSLTVQAGTGEMLVDSVAQQPFEKVVRRGDAGTGPPETCNNAWLNLDGTPGDSPW